MLSGETAMGKYPVDALKMMVSIVEETEAYLDYSAYRRRKVTEENMKNISNAVCAASVSTAHDIGADYIIAPSITGFTSMMLSKWRPAARIIGMSPKHYYCPSDDASVGCNTCMVPSCREYG